ncbi:contact-dependent growth inhibition system immunity protein [Umezawaea beigongshangensis]|uniref:contact-dependent growth inhibition system immunity protein n=1 Tax=Umezawaea beigongshangensis TaxID=2780383 RepID=UPI0018F250C8|nr:contact-dependent growth inhibition system immunity protein [Umezawaea beigongshangensis]
MDDRALSLQDLEGEQWGRPLSPTTEVTRAVFEAWQKPLAELRPVDLVVLLQQQVGLAHLVPVVLDEIDRSPYSCGGLYPGDVLVALLNVDESFWEAGPELKARLDHLVETLPEYEDELITLAAPVDEAVRRYRNPPPDPDERVTRLHP